MLSRSKNKTKTVGERGRGQNENSGTAIKDNNFGLRTCAPARRYDQIAVQLPRLPRKKKKKKQKITIRITTTTNTTAPRPDASVRSPYSYRCTFCKNEVYSLVSPH